MTFVEAADAWAIGPATFRCSACDATIEVAADGAPVESCPGCGRFPLLRRGVIPPVARATGDGFSFLGLPAIARRAAARDDVRVLQALATPRDLDAVLARPDDGYAALAAARSAELVLAVPDEHSVEPVTVALGRGDGRTAIRIPIDLDRWFARGAPEARSAALGERLLRLAGALDAATLGLVGPAGPLGLVVVRADTELPADVAATLLAARGEHRLCGRAAWLAEPELPDALRLLLAS